MKCLKCGGTDFKENKKSWRCKVCKIRIPKERAIAYERHKRINLHTDEEIDRALIFVRHVQDHLTEGRYKSMIFPPDAVVICKICKKTIDEIYEEARA